MKSKLVSVVIVNWNGQKWLGRCLDSLAHQTYSNTEIILVDNGSLDTSVSFVKRNYPSVRIVQNNANLGFAGGNNAGINAAKGDYILMLNNDTWAEKTFIQQLVTDKERLDYDVIAPHETYYNTTKKRQKLITTIDPLGHHVNLSFSQNNLSKQFYLPGVALLFSEELYRSTQGLDDRFFMYCEEVDWFWRLILLGKTFGYSDGAIVHHAGAGSSGKGLQYSVFLWRNQNTLQMLLKNYRLHTLTVILPLYLLQNVFEIIAFLIALKPCIAKSYIEGWAYALLNFKELMAKRRWVQHNRNINDWVVIKKMFIGPGKLHHLLTYTQGDKS